MLTQQGSVDGNMGQQYKLFRIDPCFVSWTNITLFLGKFKYFTIPTTTFPSVNKRLNQLITKLTFLCHPDASQSVTASVDML